MRGELACPDFRGPSIKFGKGDRRIGLEHFPSLRDHDEVMRISGSQATMYPSLQPTAPRRSIADFKGLDCGKVLPGKANSWLFWHLLKSRPIYASNIVFSIPCKSLNRLNVATANFHGYRPHFGRFDFCRHVLDARESMEDAESRQASTPASPR